MQVEKSKPISSFLQELIDEANASIETSKTKIMNVYEQALSEGFTPFTARKLVEEKIVNVSKRYIRELLPEDAKDLSKRHLYLKDDEELVPHVPVKKKQIIDIESGNDEDEPLTDIPEPEPESTTIRDGENSVTTTEYDNFDTTLRRDKELETTNQLLREAREKITEFEDRHARNEKRITLLVDDIAKRDNILHQLNDKLQKTDSRIKELAIENIGKNPFENPKTEDNGEQWQNWTITKDVEIRSQIVPFVIKYFGPKVDIFLELDIEKARRMMNR